jgi:small basic protein
LGLLHFAWQSLSSEELSNSVPISYVHVFVCVCVRARVPSHFFRYLEISLLSHLTCSLNRSVHCLAWQHIAVVFFLSIISLVYNCACCLYLTWLSVCWSSHSFRAGYQIVCDSWILVRSFMYNKNISLRIGFWSTSILIYLKAQM